ncbi:condensation domain-containing protein [Streptacidiphilus sp. P02-A3a]|uniref:condensation domain-containing protein n=1 Tax=Streptacidiphilus sp. P02-A3a TaxID=2704468 RepID=UPI0015FA00F3|nr:condensation domain-containing protein [Streptacidiphilus sp. P02-A3a]QMU69848.1 non-ribosomal peptide synthetase condensation domain protein [Streptacidiphilus sp. P02-A3a]
MIAEFTAADSGAAPLTWGQRAIWDAITVTAPEDHYFNFGRVLKVPGTRSPAEVLAALAGLQALHSALRTRLDLSGDQPRQRTERAGRLPVRLATGDPDAVLAELEAERFDYERDWPLRVALVLDGDRVGHVAIAFCHLATDGLGAEIALRDLRMLILRGAPAGGPPPPGPLDLAHWQAGPEGRRTAERAAALWEGTAREVMFDRPTAAPDRPRIWRGLLDSPAAGLAVRAVAARHGTTTATVLLAATAAVVGRFTDRSGCAMLPIVSNRFRRDTTRIVSTLSQEGLFVVGVDRGFGDLLRETEPAALRAYRSAFHDPLDRARGQWVQPLCCFNDMRFTEPGPRPCAPADILAALPRTELSWPLSQEQLNCRFCVHISGALEISVTADTAYLSRADIERVLLGLESMLLTEAGAVTGPGSGLG